jgi:copper transport protein
VHRQGRRHRRRAWLGRLAFLVFGAGATIVGVAGPASAHAQLEATVPVQSSVVLTAPGQVVLRFDEAVSVDFGSISVLALDGRRVDQGGAHHRRGEGRVVAITLPDHLARGTYVVAWRVVSDDGHPVHGAFVFSVGTAAGAKRAQAIASVLAAARGSDVVGAVYGIVRFAVFAGLLTLVGLSVVIGLLHPPAWRVRRVRRLLWASWTVAFVSTVAATALQGVYTAALPLSRVISISLVDGVLHTRFGEVQVLRLVLLVAMAPILWIDGSWRVLGARWRGAATLGLGTGLLLTPGLAGHASTIGNGLVGEALDLVHLAAAASWIGGLELLGALVVPGLAPGDRPGDVAGITRRFSWLALGAVAVVVASGTLQSLRRVGSGYALFHTTYGRILLVKVGLVVLLLVIAATTMRAVLGGRFAGVGRRRPPIGTTAKLAEAGLRGRIVAELSVVAAVLVAVSLLVEAVPARQAASAPFTASFEVLGVDLNAVVGPARVGPGNAFHFYVLDRLGQPVGIAELDASISLRSAGQGPRAIPLVVAGPGHYQAPDVDIPVAGGWDLSLTLSTSPGERQVLDTVLPVH